LKYTIHSKDAYEKPGKNQHYAGCNERQRPTSQPTGVF